MNFDYPVGDDEITAIVLCKTQIPTADKLSGSSLVLSQGKLATNVAEHIWRNFMTFK